MYFIDTQSTAEAAIVRHASHVTSGLGPLLALRGCVPAAVGHMRSHPLAQSTTLLTTGSIAVTVDLGQLGTVRPLVIAGVGGVWGHTCDKILEKEGSKLRYTFTKST